MKGITLKNSLSTRVLVLISVVIILIMANIITSFVLSSMMSTEVEEMNSIDQKYMQASESVYRHFMTIDDNTLYLTAAPENTDPEIIKLTFDAIYQSQEAMKKSLADLEGLAKFLSDKDKEDIATAIAAAKKYLAFNEKVIAVSEKDRNKGYYHMYETDEEVIVFFPLTDALALLTANSEQHLNERADSTIAFGNLQRILIGVLGMVSIIITIGVALYIRSSLKPLKIVAEKLQLVGEGNMATEDIIVHSSNEIGVIAEATNNMKNSLRIVLQKIGSHAEHVAASSEQLSASAEQTTAATEHISNVMNEVTVGTDDQVLNTKRGLQLIQDVASKLVQVSEHAEKSAQFSELATSKTDDGQESIEQAMVQMNSINQTSQSLTGIVKELGERSSEIGQIVNVIQSISSQTNLLALNAAIEAARAGESGKGFAVVAEEVRKLAEQSNRSTEQVLQLVSAIQLKTAEAVDAAETTNQEMSNGMESVVKASSAFENIQQTVIEVKHRISEVANSVKDMSQQSTLLVESIQAISEVATSNSEGTQTVSAATEEQLATMEEISASASSLSKLSEELLSDISKFRI
jgi:methyl-accepting chemotaxis protein